MASKPKPPPPPSPPRSSKKSGKAESKPTAPTPTPNEAALRDATRPTPPAHEPTAPEAPAPRPSPPQVIIPPPPVDEAEAQLAALAQDDGPASGIGRAVSPPPAPVHVFGPTVRLSGHRIYFQHFAWEPTPAALDVFAHCSVIRPDPRDGLLLFPSTEAASTAFDRMRAGAGHWAVAHASLPADIAWLDER